MNTQGVVLPWGIAVGIITFRDFKKGATNNVAGLPLPADYLATFIIFGTLSLFSGEAQKPATALAWGYVVAMLLHFIDPTFSGKNKAAPAKTTANSTTTSTKSTNATASLSAAHVPGASPASII